MKRESNPGHNNQRRTMHNVVLRLLSIGKLAFTTSKHSPFVGLRWYTSEINRDPYRDPCAFTVTLVLYI